MMPVSQLAAHPGNVRADLDLNEEFVASIAANGVLVALRITPDGEGLRVIDGGRRLAAAVKAGIEEVPFDLVAERAGDEAGQYLDMILTNAPQPADTPGGSRRPVRGQAGRGDQDPAPQDHRQEPRRGQCRAGRGPAHRRDAGSGPGGG
jgi:ParB-like nuclease family protein